MSTGPDEGEPFLAPNDAFAVLGNETRMEILQTLAEADDPLPFSELRDRVGVSDSGQFNYHLNKLVGHFLTQRDDGYKLRQPGRRVIEAVLSGAVTKDPVLEPTQIDYSCLLCGSPVEVSYAADTVELYCTGCPGLYGDKTRESVTQTDRGHIGGLTLPPAGVEGRGAFEMFQAASTWVHLEMVAWSSDVCPRCSARVAHTANVCEEHETDKDLCGECQQRHAVQVHSRCTNCKHELEALFPVILLDSPELLAFIGDHGHNLSHGHDWGWEWGEEIVSVDPFKARFSLTLEDETLNLTVNQDLDVIEATRSPSSGTR